MKKIFILLLFSAAVQSSAIAQNTSDTFGEGDNVLGIGVGLGGVYGFSGYTTQTPAFGLHFDHGFRELDMGAVIGLGGYLGYKSYSYERSFPYLAPPNNNKVYRDRWSILVLGARGTFHYDLLRVPDLDTYGGLMLAFHVVNSRIDSYPSGLNYTAKTYSSALYASLFAGAKYHFTPGFAGFMELGYGVSWLTVGGAFKF